MSTNHNRGWLTKRINLLIYSLGIAEVLVMFMKSTKHENLIKPVDSEGIFRGWVKTDDFERLLGEFEPTTTTKYIIASSTASGLLMFFLP